MSPNKTLNPILLGSWKLGMEKDVICNSFQKKGTPEHDSVGRRESKESLLGREKKKKQQNKDTNILEGK